MDHYNWALIPEEKMNPLVTRQVIHTGRMTIARLRLSKGAVVPLHQHPNEQVSMLEAGSLRFVVGGVEGIAKAGETVRIPPDVPHMVEAMEDCVAVDVFAPQREDWIRGDDAYLRR